MSVRYAPRQFGEDVPPDLWEGKAMNISQSGAALELPHRLRNNGRVELFFMQSNPPRCVSVVGTVIRSARIPGATMTDGDGHIRPLYLVALEFKRTLDLEEMALLHEPEAFDVTELQSQSDM